LKRTDYDGKNNRTNHLDGVIETDKRQQRFTVWVNGSSIYFTDDKEEAERIYARIKAQHYKR